MGKCGTTESREEKPNNIPELLSYQASIFLLIIFNGNTESEAPINTSHYLGDDQRDTKLQTFKHAALTMLRGSQPQPSRSQEIILQVATGNCGTIKLQQLYPIQIQRELQNYSTFNESLSFFGDHTHTVS